MVIILDKHKKPMGFTTEAHARRLMDKRRACVYRYYPFTIIVKDKDARELTDIPTFRIKIDPGSIHTGIAIIGNADNKVYFYMQIKHHASDIKKGLHTRKGARRNRRERETWYRKAKWGNQPVGKDGHLSYDSPRPEGWLPPSVKSIGDNIIVWVNRLKKLIPITECSFEAVRFNSQLMDNPNMEGEEYQHGTLYGYEMKEYLMEKYRHTCQYCGGKSGDPVLEWEHKVPKIRGGSDSVKNATLACKRCNGIKNDRTPEEWLAELTGIKNPSELVKARIEGIRTVISQKAPQGSNRYSAWVTSTRRYIEKALFSIFGDVECSSGGRTKYNRKQLGLPKDHHYDALCVGTVPEGGFTDRTNGYVLYAEAEGRGSRFQGRTNECGIIITKYKNRSKRRYGLQCGDYGELKVQRGKRKGVHFGMLSSVRSDGRVIVKSGDGTEYNGRHQYFKMKQHTDGYFYRCAVADDADKAS